MFVSSKLESAGDTHAIISVRELPPSESWFRGMSAGIRVWGQPLLSLEMQPSVLATDDYRDYRTGITDQRSEKRDQESGIRDQEHGWQATPLAERVLRQSGSQQDFEDSVSAKKQIVVARRRKRKRGREKEKDRERQSQIDKKRPKECG